jgi:3D (Asp-Asp-Asp) domain-containing protein
MKYLENKTIKLIVRVLAMMFLVVMLGLVYAVIENAIERGIERELIEIEEIDNNIEINARITKYGWTGNRMSNTEYPHIGAVATSDRTVKLGTRIIINDIEYIVKDRTAKWVNEEFKHQTFDIYSEDTEAEMLEFGAQIMKVIIIN